MKLFYFLIACVVYSNIFANFNNFSEIDLNAIKTHELIITKQLQREILVKQLFLGGIATVTGLGMYYLNASYDKTLSSDQLEDKSVKEKVSDNGKLLEDIKYMVGEIFQKAHITNETTAKGGFIKSWGNAFWNYTKTIGNFIVSNAVWYLTMQYCGPLYSYFFDRITLLWFLNTHSQFAGCLMSFETNIDSLTSTDKKKEAVELSNISWENYIAQLEKVLGYVAYRRNIILKKNLKQQSKIKVISLKSIDIVTQRIINWTNNLAEQLNIICLGEHDISFDTLTQDVKQYCISINKELNQLKHVEECAI